MRIQRKSFSSADTSSSWGWLKWRSCVFVACASAAVLYPVCAVVESVRAESLPVVSVRLSTPEYIEARTNGRKNNSKGGMNGVVCVDCASQVKLTVSFMIKDGWSVFGPKTEDLGERKRPLRITLEDSPGYQLRSVVWPGEAVPPADQSRGASNQVVAEAESEAPSQSARGQLSVDQVPPGGSQRGQRSDRERAADELLGSGGVGSVHVGQSEESSAEVLRGSFAVPLIVTALAPKVAPEEAPRGDVTLNQGDSVERTGVGGAAGLNHDAPGDSASGVVAEKGASPSGGQSQVALPFGDAQQGIGTVRASWTACRNGECIPGEATLLFNLGNSRPKGAGSTSPRTGSASTLTPDATTADS